MKRLLLAAAFCAAATPALALFDMAAPGIVQPYPASLTASVNATVAGFSATLTPANNKIASICGFMITSGGTTAAATVQGTIGGIVGGTGNFTYVFPSIGQGVLGVAFPQCIQATGPNIPIVVTVPAGGAGTTASLLIWGGQQGTGFGN